MQALQEVVLVTEQCYPSYGLFPLGAEVDKHLAATQGIAALLIAFICISYFLSFVHVL